MVAYGPATPCASSITVMLSSGFIGPPFQCIGAEGPGGVQGPQRDCRATYPTHRSQTLRYDHVGRGHLRRRRNDARVVDELQSSVDITRRDRRLGLLHLVQEIG